MIKSFVKGDDNNNSNNKKECSVGEAALEKFNPN